MKNPFGKKVKYVPTTSTGGDLVKDPESISSSDVSSEGDENKERGNWSAQLDFTLACVGYAVGLGNLWRFPYLCMENGGGAFLIPYFSFLFLCGMPLFFLELYLGQFSSLGPISVWKICPLFKGIGCGMLVVSAIVTAYYNVIITWVIYYIYRSMNTVLPWASCGNEWNTPLCSLRMPGDNVTLSGSDVNGTVVEGAEVTVTPYAFTHGPNTTDLINTTMKTRTPAEEFWQFEVLKLTDGIEDLGGINWPLLLCLFLSWVTVFLPLIKGVKSSGKAVYVTATLPYLLLTVLLIRGVTLPGSLEGIKFYITPDFSRLFEFKVWIEACLQIFYSLGPAWGGLVAMASYNKYHNNIVKDAVIVCIACSGTSFYAGFVIFAVIGFMANEAGLPVSEVITPGPGLAFIAYPEAITKLPISPMWAIFFFIMLLTLGLDSQFGMMETMISGLIDQFPGVFRKRKALATAGLSVIMFLGGIIFVTKAGMYLFQIVDWYCASFSVMVIALCECLVVSWIYGTDRVYYDLEHMLHFRPSIVWKILWKFVTPGIMIIILISSALRMSVPQYGDYVYPTWAIVMGWSLAMCSIVPIPLVAIYMLAAAKGTPLQRINTLLRCEKSWGPALEKNQHSHKYCMQNKAGELLQVTSMKPLHPEADIYRADGEKPPPYN